MLEGKNADTGPVARIMPRVQSVGNLTGLASREVVDYKNRGT